MVKVEKILKSSMVVSLCLFLVMSCICPISVSADVIKTVTISTSARVGNASTSINLTEDQIGRKGTSTPYARLFYKANLSSITTPVISAKLKFKAKIQSGGNLNLYKVTADWATATINDSNKPTTDSTSFASTALTYSSGSYVLKEFDITAYVQALQTNNDNLVNLMMDYTHASSSGLDTRIAIMGVTSVSTTSRPYIEIVAEDSRPVFDKPVTVNKTISSIGVIDNQNPTVNPYETREGTYTDAIGTTTYNSTDYDRRIFYKVDLSDSVGKNITSAKLVFKDRRMKSGLKMEVFKVTSTWDMGTISYNNAPAYDTTSIVSTTTPGYEAAATLKELDITSYIKSLSVGDSVANIMLKASGTDMGRSDLSQMYGINSVTPPCIEVAYTDVISSLSDSEITASCLVEKGSVAVPQNAIPILALFNGTTMEKIVIGTEQAIEGSGVVSATIDLTGMTIGASHKLKMYIWDGMVNLTPVLCDPGVLPGY